MRNVSLLLTPILIKVDMSTSDVELSRVDGHGDVVQLVLQPHLLADKVVLEAVHDLAVVLVHVDVELLQGRHGVELAAVGEAQLVHVVVQLLVGDLSGNKI